MALLFDKLLSQEVQKTQLSIYSPTTTTTNLSSYSPTITDARTLILNLSSPYATINPSINPKVQPTTTQTTETEVIPKVNATGSKDLLTDDIAKYVLLIGGMGAIIYLIKK